MRHAERITKEELLVSYIENDKGTIRSASKMVGCSMTTFLKALKHSRPRAKTKNEIVAPLWKISAVV